MRRWKQMLINQRKLKNKTDINAILDKSPMLKHICQELQIGLCEWWVGNDNNLYRIGSLGAVERYLEGNTHENIIDNDALRKIIMGELYPM